MRLSKNRKLLNRRGQGLTEYLILLILVAVVAIGVTRELGRTVANKIEIAKKRISSEVDYRRR
jgi:hypothetical protein